MQPLSELGESEHRLTISRFLPGLTISRFLPGLAMSRFLPGLTLSPFLPGLTISRFLPELTLSPFLPRLTLTPFQPGLTLTPFQPGLALSRFLPGLTLSRFLPPPHNRTSYYNCTSANRAENSHLICPKKAWISVCRIVYLSCTLQLFAQKLNKYLVPYSFMLSNPWSFAPGRATSSIFFIQTKEIPHKYFVSSLVYTVGARATFVCMA